jgi:hypothetical protein
VYIDLLPKNLLAWDATQQTLTTSRIEYQLCADVKSLSYGTFSYEDVPLDGRPVYYDSNITLRSPFSLTSSNLIPHSQDPEAAKQIKLRVGGVVI